MVHIPPVGMVSTFCKYIVREIDLSKDTKATFSVTTLPQLIVVLEGKNGHVRVVIGGSV